jgi:hypothetical protein
VRYRAIPKTTFVFGLPDGLEQVPLPCIFKISNRGDLPILEVELQLQIPTATLVEKTAFMGPLNDKLAILNMRLQSREVFRLNGHAQVRIKIGTLRPRETVLVVQPLQLRAGQFLVDGGLESAITTDRLRSRFAKVKKLRGALTVRAVVWSTSGPPVSQLFNIIWFAAGSAAELCAEVSGLAAAAADERALEPGHYLSLRPWQGVRRYLRHEFAELAVFSCNNNEELVGTLWSPASLIEAPEGQALVALPLWGFWGESFDLQRFAAISETMIFKVAGLFLYAGVMLTIGTWCLLYPRSVRDYARGQVAKGLSGKIKWLGEYVKSDSYLIDVRLCGLGLYAMAGAAIVVIYDTLQKARGMS